jgi:hypothetical protein
MAAIGVIRRDRPNERGKFAHDRDTDDIGGLTRPDKPAISGAESYIVHGRAPCMIQNFQGITSCRQRKTSLKTR